MVGRNCTKIFALRLNISLRYTSALVVHRPSRAAAASASSQERELKKTFEKIPPVAIAAQVGEILARRLAAKNVKTVHLNLEKEAVKQERDSKRFHALIGSLRRNGIEILP